MALAAYQDLCIDAEDPQVMAAFWSAALGLWPRPRCGADGPVRLVGPTPEHAVWVNPVEERPTVKQRVHLDVHADSVADLETIGATRLSRPGEFPWTVLADPEGGELCLFARADPPAQRLSEVAVDWDDPYRLYEVCVDAAEPERLTRWWGEALGASVHASERGFGWVAEVPGTPFGAVAFMPVPEPKSVKNRIHFDVCVDGSDGLEALLAHGATVRWTVAGHDGTSSWTVLADPEGNEFCVFGC